MINFCHIAPTHFLNLTNTNGAHLILAHLVESDPQYREFYQNLDDGKDKILDNSAFEMYKQGKPMYSPNKLIKMGRVVGADYIVMSDYPGQEGRVTIDAATDLAPKFRSEGFKTFFVPQSRIEDLSDYLTTFSWGLKSNLVDMIGVSILGVPNAFGVENGNKLQRFLSRYHLMRILSDQGLLEKYCDFDNDTKQNQKKLHFLGMVDGPNEIELVKEYHKYIYSWDSSAAVWAGLNNILFDNSPTGLINGKFEQEVDFNYKTRDHNRIKNAMKNIQTINSLVERYSNTQLKIMQNE